MTTHRAPAKTAASALVALTLVGGLLSGGLLFGPAAPAWTDTGTAADGTYKPYSDQYTWKDPGTKITYYDTSASNERNLNDSDAFLRQVLTAWSPGEFGKVRAFSPFDNWRFVGLLAAMSDDNFFGTPTDLTAQNFGIPLDRGFIRGFLDEAFNDGGLPTYRRIGLTAAASVKAAAESIRTTIGSCDDAFVGYMNCDHINNNPVYSDTDLAKLSDENQTTFYVIDRWSDTNWNAGVGMIFSDFQLAYLAEPPSGSAAGSATYPDDVVPNTHFSYSPSASSASYVSGTKNHSASDITTSQKVINTTEATVSNEVSSTSGYSYTTSIGSATTVKFNLLAGVSETLSLGFEWAKTLENTTTSGSSQTKSTSIENGIDVSLPGHTAVVLRQTPTDMNMSVEYDYPVAVSFKVTVVSILANDVDKSKAVSLVSARFGRDGEPDAADNLWSRWSKRGLAGNEDAHGDSLKWDQGVRRLQAIATKDTIDDYGKLEGAEFLKDSSFFLWELLGVPTDYYPRTWEEIFTKPLTPYIGYGTTYLEANPDLITERLGRLYSEQPMSRTGGVITVNSKGNASEIYGIKPLYPLRQVKLTQDAQDYDLTTGDALYVDNIPLTGTDGDGVAYYGFNRANGYWALVDDQDALLGAGGQGDDSLPAKLVKTPTGLTRLIANDVTGTAYLKYFINDTVYSYIDHDDTTTTNAELTGTGRIQVNVSKAPFKGSIDVDGNLTGYVGDPAINLDDPDESHLATAVQDTSGKELARALSWEAKELPAKGIAVANNQLSFTKPGTFHIRASSGEVQSDWVAVTALDARELASITLTDTSRPSAFTIPATATLPVSLPLSVLQVTYTDQYGDPFTPASPAVFEADGGTIDQGWLSIGSTGEAGVVAKVGGITSNRIPVLFEIYAPFTGSIDVTGNLTSYVGDPAIDLDDPASSGLTPVILDTTGKELTRALTWEAKELPSKGIEVVNNQLTFTKPGTFHIRAACAGVQTDWIEVTGLAKRELASITLTDTSTPSVFTIPADTIVPVSLPLNGLQVEYADQYGDPFTPTSPADFEATGVAAAIDQGMLVVSGRDDDAGVVAKLGGITSNRVAVDFVRPVTDTDPLQAAIGTANALTNADNTYVAESWLDFEAELANAKRVLGDEWATQQQVDDALVALQAAIGRLELTQPAPNWAVLQAAYDAALKLSNTEGTYTAETWAKLQAELTIAKLVLDDPLAGQGQIDAAAQALNAALAGLAPVVPSPAPGVADLEPKQTLAPSPETFRLVVSKVKLNQSQLRLVKGKSLRLKKGVYYANAHTAWAGKVIWKSSNPKIAAVDRYGTVKAKKPGKATISVTTKDATVSGAKLTAKVKVIVVKSKGKATVTKVWAKVPKSMKAGQTVYITGKYKSTKATGVKVTYKTSKRTVIGSDRVGRLVAKAKGTAKITVKAGGKSKTYKITVK